MLNHYFDNRAELLRQALVHVSARSQERYERAIDGVPPGRERFEALLDSVLGEDAEALETWRVWINATGEAVRLPELRRTIEERLSHWFELVEVALEGLVDAEPASAIPWTWRVDALLTGLTTQALTSEAELGPDQIRDEVVRMVLAGGGRERIAVHRELAR
jgi:AcrR family transcriptional regulator